MNVFFISLSVCLMLSMEVWGDTDSEFIRAALDDTSDRVMVLFEKGVNINAKDDDGETALMKASNNGRYKTVKFLIENGADVHAKNKIGETPLMFASAFDNSDIVKLLIGNGADVNEKDNGGWSALIYAAYNGRDKTVRLLLRKGASADYALQYIAEDVDFSRDDVYERRGTSNVSGYQTAADTINKNKTFWQSVKSYIE